MHALTLTHAWRAAPAGPWWSAAAATTTPAAACGRTCAPHASARGVSVMHTCQARRTCRAWMACCCPACSVTICLRAAISAVIPACAAEHRRACTPKVEKVLRPQMPPTCMRAYRCRHACMHTLFCTPSSWQGERCRQGGGQEGTRASTHVCVCGHAGTHTHTHAHPTNKHIGGHAHHPAWPCAPQPPLAAPCCCCCVWRASQGTWGSVAPACRLALHCQ